jgi:hypothetical protein
MQLMMRRRRPRSVTNKNASVRSARISPNRYGRVPFVRAHVCTLKHLFEPELMLAVARARWAFPFRDGFP